MSFRQDPFSNSGGLRFGSGLPIGPAMRGLLIANALIFFVPSLFGLQDSWSDFLKLQPRAVILGGQVWQLVSYMFLHANFQHLFWNMLMLWMFGTALEHLWGTRPFLMYYFICGVGAALLQTIVAPTSYHLVLGASGAIYGVLLAYGLVYPDQIVLLFFVLPMRMKYVIWLAIGTSLVLSLVSVPGDSVAHLVHLGGALTGWLYLKQDWRMGAFGKRLRARRARRQMDRNAQASQNAQERSKSVDEILDKISEQGIDSLTEEEKRILREASRQ